MRLRRAIGLNSNYLCRCSLMSKHLLFVQLNFGKNNGRRQLSRKVFARAMDGSRVHIEYPKREANVFELSQMSTFLAWNIVLGSTPHTDSYGFRNFVNCDVRGKIPHTFLQRTANNSFLSHHTTSSHRNNIPHHRVQFQTRCKRLQPCRAAEDETFSCTVWKRVMLSSVPRAMVATNYS